MYAAFLQSDCTLKKVQRLHFTLRRSVGEYLYSPARTVSGSSAVIAAPWIYRGTNKNKLELRQQVLICYNIYKLSYNVLKIKNRKEMGMSAGFSLEC